MSIATGTVLADRWELTSRLAVGGMGDVFRAHDRDSGEEVAVKVLRSGVLQGEERFAGEVATLRRLDHPHVVGVVDAGEEDGLPYLVMELLPGRSLSDLLRDGALPLDRVHHIGTAIAAALDYTHGRGVINRDIKPSNILFTAEGTAKLADFGIAKLLDASGITATGQALGTASFIAPEQLSAPDRVGPPTDIYSLGLVLLEAATGQRAFAGTGSEAAMARLARDPEIPASLPDGWQQLLRRMTARDPAARPTAAQVVQVLDDDLSQATLRGLPPPSTPTAADQDTVPFPMVGGVGAAGVAGTAAAAGSPADPEQGDVPSDGAAASTRAMAGTGGRAAATADEPTGAMVDAGVGGAAASTHGDRGAAAPGSPGISRAWWVAVLLALVAAGLVWAFAAELGPFADDPAETPSEAPADPDPAEQEPADEEPEVPADDAPDGDEAPAEDPGDDQDPQDEPAAEDEGPGPDPDAGDDPQDDGGVDLPAVDEDALDLEGPAQGGGGGLIDAPGQNEDAQP